MRAANLTDQGVIVLEFNELTPRLMQRWIDEGRLPGFARLQSESHVFITDAEEKPPYLEPWIQWVTVHTGLPYAQHRVFDLGDGHKLDAPRLWDIVSDAGKRVWICGSMNAAVRGGGLNGALIPDPWCDGVQPYPQGRFDPFFHFIRTYVQEHASGDVPLRPADYARFATFMLSHGLSAKTVHSAVSQLARERGGRNRWKRVTILDRLMWDVFRAEWRQRRPHYATLFLNSTAHLQHYHWRNMEPGAFKLKPPQDEQDEYADAIFEGYRAMDLIVQEALELVEGTQTSLVLLTALSQQPLVRYEDDGGKQVFKPRDALELLRFAGCDRPARYMPVMAEQYHLYLDSPAAAEEAEQALARLTLDGAPLMEVRRTGSELFVGCAIVRAPSNEALVRVGTDGRSAPFWDLLYPVQGLKSGGHHPDGLFWARTPERLHHVEAKRVPLRRVAPTLATLAGLSPETVADAFAPPPLLEAGESTPVQESVPA